MSSDPPAADRPDVTAWVVVGGIVLLIAVLFGRPLLRASDRVGTGAGAKDAVVAISAPGSLCWSANVGGATQEGCGDKAFSVHDGLGLFSSNVQKKSAGSEVIRISVQVDGQVAATNSTSAAYGVAQVVVDP